MWDVAICGAGPAGSALAILLARRGLAVAIADAQSFPRDKPCGEAMGPGVAAFLDRHGLASALPRTANPLHGIRLSSPAAVLEIRYRAGQQSASGFGISRRELDTWLLEEAIRAGTRHYPEAHVLGRSPAGLRIMRGDAASSIPARIVVGAGGLGCPIARALGGRRSTGRVAFRAQVEGVDGVGSWGEAHLVGRGFVGIARIGRDCANVTAVLDRRDLLVQRGRPPLAIWRDAVSAAGLAPRVHPDGYPGPIRTTGPLGYTPGRLFADGTVVLGDAAGFVDPFTGDGVALALKSAELLAPILADSLEPGGSDRSPISAWAHAHRRAIAPRLRFDRALQMLVTRPRAAARVVSALAHRLDLAERLLAVPADLAPPRSVLAPDVLLPMARLLFSTPRTLEVTS